MYEFIVLGLVPGTHIQITFKAWLYIAVGLFIAGTWWKLHRLHWFRNTLIGLAFMMSISTRRRLPA